MPEKVIHDSTDIVHQGDALDFMCEKYIKKDLLSIISSIIWVKTDDKGFHHFQIILRS
jgi:hypothetical protein